MKAFVLREYGLPNVLKLEEVDKPVPKEEEVLLKIHAVSLNDWDWGLVRGKPFIIRMMNGIRKPKAIIPGVDVAGTIEELGSQVSDFKVGEAVYCDLSNDQFGGFAEYVSVPVKSLSRKPDNISMVQAAALPHAALLALQGLKLGNEIVSGQKVLVNGAGGGVGTLLIQMLASSGAEFTGVDSGEKLELMQDMGYHQVIDYREQDFTQNGVQYDFILDTKSNRSAFKYANVLTKTGRYVTVGGTMGRLFQVLLIGGLYAIFTKKKLMVLGLEPNKGLEEVSELVAAGKLVPKIDGPHSFENIPTLLQYFGDGKHKGKVIVEVAAN